MRKSVNFGKKDKALLEHWKNQNIPFSTYIKQLIKEDVRKESLDDTIKRLVQEYLKSYKIEEPKDFDNSDIEDLKRFMGS